MPASIRGFYSPSSWPSSLTAAERWPVTTVYGLWCPRSWVFCRLGRDTQYRGWTFWYIILNKKRWRVEKKKERKGKKENLTFTITFLFQELCWALYNISSFQSFAVLSIFLNVKDTSSSVYPVRSAFLSTWYEHSCGDLQLRSPRKQLWVGSCSGEDRWLKGPSWLPSNPASASWWPCALGKFLLFSKSLSLFGKMEIETEPISHGDCEHYNYIKCLAPCLTHVACLINICCYCYLNLPRCLDLPS